MANNYVRFLRGTPIAYQTALEKNTINDNTLYFISDKDSNNGVLYIGKKKIADGADSSINFLNRLEDVIVRGAAAGSILVYTNEGKWESQTAAEVAKLLIIEMQGATADKAGSKGAVPAPAAGQQDLFLKGDGTWANPVGNLQEKLKELEEHTISDLVTRVTNLEEAFAKTKTYSLLEWQELDEE